MELLDGSLRLLRERRSREQVKVASLFLGLGGPSRVTHTKVSAQVLHETKCPSLRFRIQHIFMLWLLYRLFGLTASTLVQPINNRNFHYSGGTWIYCTFAGF